MPRTSPCSKGGLSSQCTEGGSTCLVWKVKSPILTDMALSCPTSLGQWVRWLDPRMARGCYQELWEGTALHTWAPGCWWHFQRGRSYVCSWSHPHRGFRQSHRWGPRGPGACCHLQGHCSWGTRCFSGAHCPWCCQWLVAAETQTGFPHSLCAGCLGQEEKNRIIWEQEVGPSSFGQPQSPDFARSPVSVNHFQTLKAVPCPTVKPRGTWAGHTVWLI